MGSRRETLLSFLYATRPLTRRVVGRPRIRVREALAYTLTFALAIVLVGAILRWHITGFYEEQTASWRARLSGLADDQTQRVSDWLQERQGDAQVLSASHSVRALLRAHYEAGQLPKDRSVGLAESLAALDEMAKRYSYSGVYIIDRDARVVVQSSRSIPVNPLFSETCRAVSRSGLRRIALVGDAPNRTQIGFGAPAFPGPGATDADRSPGRALGMVLLVSDASQTLFPLVTREALPTRTSETDLVRRDGNAIVYFSPLRLVPARSPPLRFPLATSPLTARLALEGRETFANDTDYRGVLVLAATQHIPLAGWGLVRKIDRTEAMKGFRRLTNAEWQTAVLRLILLAGLLMFHRHHVVTRELKQEEKKFQALLESPPDVMIVIGRAGHIVFVNSATERMFGYSLEELLGKTFLTLVPERFRAECAEYYSRLFSDPALHDQQMQQDRWGLRKDGSEFPAEVRSSTIETLQGSVLAIAVRDITERKRAEAEHVRLVAAIEQSAEAVMITDTNGDIEYVNPAFTLISGYSREEVLGQNPKILKSDKQDTAFFEQLWATIRRGEIWHGEIVNRRKGGKLHTDDITVAPVRSSHGEVTHFIATMQDVTERRSLEEHVRQMVKLEAIGRLAGGVAHDFNNLLTVINGYSDLLLETLGSGNEARPQLQEIRSAGERAASLTQQLLAFSRRQVLAPQVLDLNALVSNLEKMLKRLIGEDINLRTALDPSLGRVKADPGQIGQVIMNLALNARDAMPSGGNLTLETSNVELDESFARSHVAVKLGPHVMLAVADTGVGIPPEVQAHIFEPFFTTKEKGKGTGLGLATVYGIVKQSGGSIWLFSEPGQGAVFKIYLPIVSDESLAEGRDADTEKDAARGTETILVVEDEKGVRSLIRLALESTGYKVLAMADGESALATCANHDGPIHLLLTDVVMPKMSGPLLAEKVTALRPDIRVVYMSGYTDDAVVHHGVLSHEMPFIQKPFSPIALCRKIRGILQP